ncbi:MAG: polyprenyl synthetase family protein [Planctomycetota bacterium]
MTRSMMKQASPVSNPVHVDASAAPPPWAATIVRRVDEAMGAFVRTAGMPESLRAAVEYSALSGGKRVRPVLAWLCAEAAGKPGDVSLPAGVAVELIHAFSLVHDDLPALDDDDLRRGRPTLHKHAGEAMAVLAGDAMLTLAFSAIEGVLDARVRDPLRAELVAGTMGMIGGQVYDTLGGLPEGLSDHEQLETVHRGKTGALLRASCRMGAMCAHADDDQLAAVSRYAEAIGLLFQIVDDLIDVEQTAEHVGKRTGKDAEAGKRTYPGVLGLDGARAAADETLGQAVSAAETFGADGERLVELARYLRVRTR